MASLRDENPVAHGVFTPFRLVWRLSMSLVLVWLLACAIQIGYVAHNDLDPQAHFEAQMDYYLAELGDRSGMATEMALKGYELVFSATEAQRRFFAGVLDKKVPQPTGPVSKLGGVLRQGVRVGFRYPLRIAGYTTLLLGVKLAVGFVGLFLLGSVWLIAVVDGLAKRSIRKACAGKESALIYHRAKHLGFWVLLPGMAVVHLCSPVPINPAWIILPGGLLGALAIRLQAEYFKKYL